MGNTQGAVNQPDYGSPSTGQRLAVREPITLVVHRVAICFAKPISTLEPDDISRKLPQNSSARYESPEFLRIIFPHFGRVTLGQTHTLTLTNALNAALV